MNFVRRTCTLLVVFQRPLSISCYVHSILLAPPAVPDTLDVTVWFPRLRRRLLQLVHHGVPAGTRRACEFCLIGADTAESHYYYVSLMADEIVDGWMNPNPPCAMVHVHVI